MTRMLAILLALLASPAAAFEYALVNASGVVVNIIDWNGVTPWEPPAGLTPVAATGVGIGWTYVNGQFTAPVVTPPVIVPPAAISPSAVIGACNAQSVGSSAYVSQTLGGQLVIIAVTCNGTQWVH